VGQFAGWRLADLAERRPGILAWIKARREEYLRLYPGFVRALDRFSENPWVREALAPFEEDRGLFSPADLRKFADEKVRLFQAGGKTWFLRRGKQIPAPPSLQGQTGYHYLPPPPTGTPRNWKELQEAAWHAEYNWKATYSGRDKPTSEGFSVGENIVGSEEFSRLDAATRKRLRDRQYRRQRDDTRSLRHVLVPYPWSPEYEKALKQEGVEVRRLSEGLIRKDGIPVPFLVGELTPMQMKRLQLELMGARLEYIGTFREAQELSDFEKVVGHRRRFAALLQKLDYEYPVILPKMFAAKFH
jgi:hypothetical protein